MFSSEVLSVSSVSTTSSRDYNQLGMETLLKLKRTYINRFEYEKAKKVQAVINERKIEDINGIIQECIDKIDQKFNEVETDLQKKRELTNSLYKFKELDILEKIDNAFLIVKDRHVKELATIEKQKALAYVRAIHKPIKESRELLAQSKRLAENDDFDGAVRVREQSRKVKEEIIQTRKDQVNQKYELMRRKLYTKQKSDLQILSGKLTSGLYKNENEKIESLRSHSKLAKNTIIFQEQKILGELLQKIRSKDKKLVMADQVNKFFSQRFTQFNERIEQADKEALKSQVQSSATSEADLFNSGEESIITTDTVEPNIDFDNGSNQNYEANLDILSEGNNSEIEKENDNNNDLNFNDDDFVEDDGNNNFDEGLLQLSNDQTEKQEDQINHDNLENSEVYIEDSDAQELQQNNEEEQINSDLNNEEEQINSDLNNEEEQINSDLNNEEEQIDYNQNNEEEQINSNQNNEEDQFDYIQNNEEEQFDYNQNNEEEQINSDQNQNNEEEQVYFDQNNMTIEEEEESIANENQDQVDNSNGGQAEPQVNDDYQIDIDDHLNSDNSLNQNE